MPVFRTSQGRSVPHCHMGQPTECQVEELSPSTIEQIRDWLRRHHPNVVEVAAPTNTYNCIGYAFANSHGWFNYPERFLTDDYVEASFDDPAKDDVVKYLMSGKLMHVGVVTRVSNGRIARVRSKWGNWSLLSHSLRDVFSDLGEPVVLLRPRPGVVMPFAPLFGDEEMPEPTGVRAPLVSVGDENMAQHESTEEAIHRAVERISDPDVYIRVGLASTPEAARTIIEALPGVRQLIDIGPEAAEEVLKFWRDAQERHETELSAIALYLLQRIPTEEAAQPLAEAISAGKFTGLNMHLAADALLTSAGIESVSENPLTVALREAENLK